MAAEFLDKLHRTWVQVLIEFGHREPAAAVIDAELSLLNSNFSDYGISVGIPVSAYGLVMNTPGFKDALEKSLKLVGNGYFQDQNGNDTGEPHIEFRIKLIEVEEGWKSIVRDLIINFKDANQGRISELIFAKRQQNLYVYNEMKFASKSEIRIAQEFESRRVLFFPLPLAVRAETGNGYQDHREIDFLVCDDGVWGILEVSYHPDRFEKDAEKDAWFKNSGILCIQHYSAERCYERPGEVVKEFLTILAKHKR